MAGNYPTKFTQQEDGTLTRITGKSNTCTSYVTKKFSVLVIGTICSDNDYIPIANGKDLFVTEYVTKKFSVLVIGTNCSDNEYVPFL